MDDMLKEFVVEALDLATNVEEHLLSLERNPGDMNTLNAVFRSFHTIKGGAGFMNLTAMVSACHLTENLFDALRTGQAAVTPEAIEAALEASGFVADQLTALNNGTPTGTAFHHAQSLGENADRCHRRWCEQQKGRACQASSCGTSCSSRPRRQWQQRRQALQRLPVRMVNLTGNLTSAP